MTEHELNPEHDRVATGARERIQARIAATATNNEPFEPPEGAFEDDDLS